MGRGLREDWQVRPRPVAVPGLSTRTEAEGTRFGMKKTGLHRPSVFRRDHLGPAQTSRRKAAPAAYRFSRTSAAREAGAGGLPPVLPAGTIVAAVCEPR